MLICNVSLRAQRRAIVADIAEAAVALDASTTGTVVFATLVDDPASVGDIVDAFLGEIMVEAASAIDSIIAGSAFNTAIVEATSAASVPDASITPAGTLDAATTAWIAAVVGAGGTVSSGRQVVVNDLIVGLKADGIWTKLDRLWLFAAENSQSALMDLVAATSAGLGGSPLPSFTTDRGYTGGGGNGYIETFFAGSPAVGHYVQNSAHIGMWSNTATAPDSNPSMGTNSAVCDYIYVRQTSSGSAFWGIQDSGFTLSNTMASGLGHYIANRSASNAQQGYKNGSVVISNTTASISPSAFNFIVLGAGGQRSNIQASAAHIGGSLTATDVGNFYTRLRTYMTAVGVP